jgi:hypothetical protein
VSLHRAVASVTTAFPNGRTAPQTRWCIVGPIEALGSKDVPFFAAFLFDKNDFVAAYAAHAIERITKEDFGFPHCGETGGPCGFGYGIDNARRWWNTHKRSWAQQQQLPQFRRLDQFCGGLAVVDDLKSFGQFKQLRVWFGQNQIGDGKCLSADSGIGALGKQIETQFRGVPEFPFDCHFSVISK